MYHINPRTGNTGLCRARDECPFGGEDFHFESENEARKAFEATQETFSKPAKKARVYRVGKLELVDEHFPELQKVIDDFEVTVPEGRQGRKTALFASPDLASHSRWILGVDEKLAISHELSMDPSKVFVCPIELYEKASAMLSMGRKEEFKKLAEEYWESGLTLTEWQTWAAEAKPPSGSWEILVPPSEIASVKPVSNRRAIEHADPKRQMQVNWLLEPRRASKGLIWKREQQ